jgi:pimeloyl-ACP methyl ester carboxylesterase
MLRANLAVAYARPERLTEATVTRYRDMMLAPGVRRAMLARMGQTVLHDPAPILARITAPVLLLWGERDAMIPIGNAADYLRDLPHASLVRLPDLGHVPFEEDPARSLPPVEAFLSATGAH